LHRLRVVVVLVFLALLHRLRVLVVLVFVLLVGRDLDLLRVVFVEVGRGILRVVRRLRLALLRPAVRTRRERALERATGQIRRIATGVARAALRRQVLAAAPADLDDVLLRRPHHPGLARAVDRQRARAADLVLVDLVVVFLRQSTYELDRRAQHAVGLLVPSN